jgi:type II restriction enzyme
MSYKDKIKALIGTVPKVLVDLGIERERARTPTQASSNFITNREQGDWAESLVLRAFNETSKNFVAVKYGKSEDRVAGEDGFDEFYQHFQVELDTIGKRPDVLIFKKENYNPDWNFDISQLQHDTIHPIVPLAIAGIEIRSSAFLIERYDLAMQVRIRNYTEIALRTKEKILTEYADLLEHPSRKKYIEILHGINEETLSAADFRRHSWSSSERLIELSEHFKILKEAIAEVQKRDFLSITPKVEDLKVVYLWTQVYNVPHFYFQVFMDKIYGITFENLLAIISKRENKGSKFYIEKNSKNQLKTTIHINVNEGILIASKVEMPTHKSKFKELDRGRLLFYVTFEGGVAYLDVNNLRAILGINENEF